MTLWWSKHVGGEHSELFSYQCLDVAARISKNEVDDGLLDAHEVIFTHLVRETQDEIVLVLTQSWGEQRQHAVYPRPVEWRNVLRVDAVRDVVVVSASIHRQNNM